MDFHPTRSTILLIAAFGVIALTSCVAKAARVVTPPTDAQLRGLAPHLAGNWLVTEPGKPRMIWVLQHNGTAVDGTMAVDVRDTTATNAASPQPFHGSLVGVGETWQVQATNPNGFMTMKDLSFRFCPLAGGTGGCRDGQQIFGPIPTPTPMAAPIGPPTAASLTASGVASPAATGAASP
jgi:hypothetical protein